MTYQQTIHMPSATGGDTHFGDEDIFYSRTDARGVIRAGNDVFQRVSGFEWDDLLGVPHKVVRHEDMPRGLFHLYWRRMKAGKHTGAYVKNRTSSGRHYWVFSVASPIADGFVSVRIKPMGTMLPRIEALYAELLQDEAAGLTPEKSEQRLVQKLREMGFASYDRFQAIQLTEELQARQGRLGRAPLDGAETFRAMQDAYTTVEAETVDMAKVFEEVRTIPVNMRILASRLDDAGGPIDAIAINYGAMSAEMSAWLRAFSEGEKSVYAAIGKALWELSFLIGACAVQDEIARVFAADRTALPETVDRAEEAAILESLSVEYWSKVRVQLNLIAKSARTLEDGITNMKRQIIGLSSTRMMCKSESAILGKAGETLTAIVAHLDSIQVQIETRLRKMNEMTQVITGGARTLTANAARSGRG